MTIAVITSWRSNAERRHEQNLDPGEDVEVFTAPPDQVLAWIREGVIQNSLVVCALARIFDLRNENSSET